MHLSPKYLDLLADGNIAQSVLFTVFGSTTVERGIDYFEDESVISIQSAKDEAGNVNIIAKVQGQARLPYITTLNYNEKVSLWLTGSCSCPVHVNCKHSVAALFAYLEQLAPKKTRETAQHFTPLFTAASLPTARRKQVSAIDLWLQGLASAGKSNPLQRETLDDLPPAQAKLIYLLEPDSRKTGLISLGIYKSAPLKKGGMGKPNPISLDSLLTPFKTRNYQYEPRDLMIGQLLASPELRFTAYWHTGTLSGTAGEQVLQEALQTGKVYWANPTTWQHNAQPLRAAETRNMQIVWRKDESLGQYLVDLEASPAITQHFWLNGQCWYIDLPQLSCGLLEHPDLTAQQIDKLLSAPPIPEEEAAVISERLLEILPDADIPAPSPQASQQVENLYLDMHPHLLLHGITPPELGRRVHLASISFAYGEHLLRPSTPSLTSQLKVGNHRYRIHRNKEAEQAAIDALTDYGFEAHNKGHFSNLHPLDMLIHGSSRTQTALCWHDFLEYGLPALEQAGWQIVKDDNFALQFDAIDALDADWAENGNDWFELSLGFVVDGFRVNLLPILVEMLTQMENPQDLRDLLRHQEFVLIPVSDSRWVKLDSKRLENIVETLVELFDHQPLNADGNLDFSHFQGANLASLLNAQGIRWKGAEELQALTQKLQDFSGIQPIPAPEGLNASLRPYQHEGVNWLQFLREFKFNGILADDMGLGKTLQALTHLLVEKQAGRMTLPSLVIAPTSLMGNWRREAARFTPELRVQVIHGSDRQRYFDNIQNFDLILTTYPLILRDEEQYQSQAFHYLILDEAQAIKNAASKTTQIIYTLKAQHRLCLTGTPLENHLGELWSMYHFLMPGFLSTHEKFTRLFRTPIEKQSDMGRQQQLRNRVLPFMLRRTKELVASELPAKTEIIRSIPLEGKQRDLYETVRLAMDAKVREEINKKGLARSQIMILDALLKLRQVCCDPRLVKLDKAQKVQASAKLELLMGMLPEMVEEGRKVLLFSQFTSMLALIEEQLKAATIRYTKLTGQTKDRESVIAAFQEGDAQVFLISLKAGGTGLNLTAADTVIHYDPWWNPAVEQQATDRAYRIGQDKPVFVYKLITEETVEEKILKLQERKQALADGLYSEQDGEESVKFSADDLLDLLKPLEK